MKITNQPFHFDIMPTNQRKIIHEIVRNIDEISSYSQGTNNHRHVIIKLEIK